MQYFFLSSIRNKDFSYFASNCVSAGPTALWTTIIPVKFSSLDLTPNPGSETCSVLYLATISHRIPIWQKVVPYLKQNPPAMHSFRPESWQQLHLICVTIALIPPLPPPSVYVKRPLFILPFLFPSYYPPNNIQSCYPPPPPLFVYTVSCLTFIRIPLPFIRGVGGGLLGKEAAGHGGDDQAANDEDLEVAPNNIEVL